jgi:hypothetical protein
MAPPMLKANPAASYDRAVQAALLETGLPGFKEVLDYTFYDSFTLATATTQESTLFQTPTTNLLNSNFTGQGSFPAGQAFLVRSLRFCPTVNCTLADMLALIENITVTLALENSKKYVEALGKFFPAGVGATTEDVPGTTAALATGLQSANNGIAALGNTYRFTRPVVLRTLQPFSVVCKCTSMTLAATRRIYIALDGVFVRNTI